MSSSWTAKIKAYLKGFLFFSFLEGIHREKQRLDDLIMLCLFGKIVGLAGLFNYYHLRLMPFYVGRLYFWKRRVLREKDFFDHIRD